MVEPHTEEGTGHEELYFVARGSATFTLEDESFHAPAGTYVFLPDPTMRRHATADEPGTTVLSFGGWRDRPFHGLRLGVALPRQGRSATQDPQGARKLYEEALASDQDSQWAHYDFACWHALYGEEQEARRLLDRAIELGGDEVRDASRQGSRPGVAARDVSARLVIDPAFAVAAVDERLFGSFVEHMGRAVYGGIYEPGHPTADEDGFRGDVLELTRELGVTVVRYPGGNFVSAYDWEDGVGPREQRPTRLDLAWRSIEPNEVGTDEFIGVGAQGGREPMLRGQSRHARRRRGAQPGRVLQRTRAAPAAPTCARENGHADPYGVKLWCLGNEMDGPWQIGQKTAVRVRPAGRRGGQGDAARRPVDRARRVRQLQLARCRPSARGRTRSSTCAWDVADYISLHTYYDPANYPDLDAFLACSLDLDRMHRHGRRDRRRGRRAQAQPQADRDQRRRVERLAPAGQPAPRRRHRPVQARAAPDRGRPDAGRRARRRLPADHAAAPRRPREDRLPGAAGQRDPADADARRRAGVAADQLLPVHARSRYGRGTVLRIEPDAPTYEVEGEGAVSALEATAVLDEAGGAMTLFAVNRGADALPLTVTLRDLGGASVAEHIVLAGDDLDATNTAEAPDRVAPSQASGASVEDGTLRAELPPRSWNVLRLTGAR